MALLYHWRGDNYRRDLNHGVGFHLNQANLLLHEVGLGDSVWAFTRAASRAYALAAELVVSAKTRNPPGYRYGPYRGPDIERARKHDSRPEAGTRKPFSAAYVKSFVRLRRPKLFT